MEPSQDIFRILEYLNVFTDQFYTRESFYVSRRDTVTTYRHLRSERRSILRSRGQSFDKFESCFIRFECEAFFFRNPIQVMHVGKLWMLFEIRAGNDYSNQRSDFTILLNSVLYIFNTVFPHLLYFLMHSFSPL